MTGNRSRKGAISNPSLIRMYGIADGTRLRVSYYHPHIIYDGQVCICAEEPATLEILRDQARRVAELWGADSYHMSHDERQVLGWDESCRKSGRSSAEIAAHNLKFCTDLLRKTAPTRESSLDSQINFPLPASH